ncbi:class I SAM-dependent methyltransferase [Foetidibacter luteolus]|uniref:class I SAM-dependent methyltransferase n=1 Tax=Foetidibacter luteolus TaxID=2608880 RepID=UPI00129A671B|nr:methyltransferase domain-containing protein [Foetidibacter luteolus]
MSNNLKYLHAVEEDMLKSPQVIVPMLLKLLQPSSVVDVGCGLGAFLHVFQQNGIENILGIDGEWVDRSQLLIPADKFLVTDLEHKIRVAQKFDLVVSLEVGEHLADNAAEVFVESLTSLGDVIVFSAALPHQRGQNHINEQSFSYWVKKFAEKGFHVHDIFRPYWWNDTRVAWCYRQNMFLFVKKSVGPIKFIEPNAGFANINDYIHPELFEIYVRHRTVLEGRLAKIMEGRANGRVYFQFLTKFLKRKIFGKKSIN